MSRYDQLHLSNYATIQVEDEIARVDGVGDVHIFGQQDYSMRVWVDPDQLASLNLTAFDVVERHQRAEHAGGRRAGRSTAEHDGAAVRVYASTLLAACPIPKQFEQHRP